MDLNVKIEELHEQERRNGSQFSLPGKVLDLSSQSPMNAVAVAQELAPDLPPVG